MPGFSMIWVGGGIDYGFGNDDREVEGVAAKGLELQDGGDTGRFVWEILADFIGLGELGGLSLEVSEPGVGVDG